MTRRAVVTCELTAEGEERLADLGYAVVRAGWGATGEVLPTAGLVELLVGAEVLLTEIEVVDAALLDAAGDLRFVGTARGTPANVDLDAATARGIPVVHTPARNAESVADHVIWAMLSSLRRLDAGQAHLRANGWHVGDDLPYLHFRGPELGGRTLGLVGCGAVARAVARRAAGGFGMRILGVDPYADPADAAAAGIALVDLDTLLAESDVVSLHVPDTPETRGLLGAEQLARMRPDAHLVNTARAACVDEAALVAALERGAIAGAALDVFWTEPLPRDHPLLRLAHVTITPHLAGAATDVVAHHTRMLCDDVARWRAGERPRHLANAAVWAPAD